MHYLYRIAGLKILCDIPFSIVIQEESKDFLTVEYCEDADVYLHMHECARLPELPENGYWRVNKYYADSLIAYRSSPVGSVYAAASVSDDRIDFSYLHEGIKHLNYSHNILELLDLESLLLQNNGIMLHSSLIRCDHGGVLFSASSGTGKSTQAALWEQYKGAVTLDGDRSGVCIRNGKCTAYGIPFAGSSGICRNESAEVRAIVMLAQAKQNTIRTLRPAEAMNLLFPQTNVHHWDRAFTEKIMNVLISIVSTVPVYQLSCLPDEGAVTLLYETVFSERGKIVND